MGKCSSCGEWNSFVEEIETKSSASGSVLKLSSKSSAAKPIHEIEIINKQGASLDDQELNRVLGGNLVPGSVVLIGGEPGVGKSTLLLQLALQFKDKVLYVSGEESEQQIKLRADRIGHRNEQCLVLTETSVANILEKIEASKPNLVVIDSIQTLFHHELDSIPGTISQVRACANELIKTAKENDIPIFIIGHITKEGSLAGPKVLEHMVDTVLLFEGERHLSYRILRTSKNRFGSTSELGIYEMQSYGLREVSNPSEILLSSRGENTSGTAVAATLEGARPLLVDIQALASVATYGTPQRSTTGYDTKRMNMLLAVLEKRCGIRLSNQDIFLNIAGGLKITDPAVDLAICVSIFSSFEEMVVPKTTCFAGEVGLSGEIRAVNRIENRIVEAERLGFEQIYISSTSEKSLGKKDFDIKISTYSKLVDVLQDLFG